jgi:hypothetical protein
VTQVPTNTDQTEYARTPIRMQVAIDEGDAAADARLRPRQQDWPVDPAQTDRLVLRVSLVCGVEVIVSRTSSYAVLLLMCVLCVLADSSHPPISSTPPSRHPHTSPIVRYDTRVIR